MPHITVNNGTERIEVDKIVKLKSGAIIGCIYIPVDDYEKERTNKRINSICRNAIKDGNINLD